MKKFLLIVLLAAFVAVTGTAFANPVATISFNSGFRAVTPSTSSDKTEFTGTNWMAVTYYSSDGGSALFADLSVGGGLKNGGIDYLWAYPTLGYQEKFGPATLQVFGKLNLADIDFRAGASLFGQIPFGSNLIVLGSSFEWTMPFVKKSYATQGNDNLAGISAKPRLSVVFDTDKEAGFVGWVSWDNKLINSKTWTSQYIKAFFRWGSFSVSGGIESNPYNLKDGNPQICPVGDIGIILQL